MGLEHVEKITASSQSTVDFTNVFGSSDGADRYVYCVDNFVPSGDNNTLEVRFSSDGGSNWDSGASDYAWSRHRTREDGSTNTDGSAGDSEIRFVIGNVGSDPSTNETSMAFGTVHEPTNSNRATVLRNKTSFVDASPDFSAIFSGGERLTQSSIDSMQFIPQSDNISSGIFTLYKVTESSGGVMDHIQTIEASSQASVDFDGVFGSSDGYDRYMIFADNVIPATDGQDLYGRFSSDGGSSWDSGSSDYAWSSFVVTESGSTAGTGSTGSSQMQLNDQLLGGDTGNNDTSTFQIVVSDPTNSNRATVLRNSTSHYDNSVSNSLQAEYTGGIRLTQSAIDSIQFLMSSGNISSGIFSVYGLGS